MTTMRTEQTSVIPDGLQGRAGTQEPPHSLNPWVPALRYAAAGMTVLTEPMPMPMKEATK
jgi:hypothetical protein